MSCEWIIRTPWDKSCLGMETYEVLQLNDEVAIFMRHHPGHYTFKAEPLSCKEMLHKYGFYYCDTLIEPYCTRDRLIAYDNQHITLLPCVNLPELEPIVTNVFEYSRFYRDFNIEKTAANNRFLEWLKQLQLQNAIFNFYYDSVLMGFVACKKNQLVLHALDSTYRNKGLAKYCWTKICLKLFVTYSEITSSISTANSNVLNLYASLGFRFRHPKDVYHCLIR